MRLFSCSKRWCISRAPMLLEQFSSPWTAHDALACEGRRRGRVEEARCLSRRLWEAPAPPPTPGPPARGPRRGPQPPPPGRPHPEEGEEPAPLALGLLAPAHHALGQRRVAVETAEEAAQRALRVGRRLPLKVLLGDELAEGHSLGELAVELVQDLHPRGLRRLGCLGTERRSGRAHPTRPGRQGSPPSVAAPPLSRRDSRGLSAPSPPAPRARTGLPFGARPGTHRCPPATARVAAWTARATPRRPRGGRQHVTMHALRACALRLRRGPPRSRPANSQSLLRPWDLGCLQAPHTLAAPLLRVWGT